MKPKCYWKGCQSEVVTLMLTRKSLIFLCREHGEKIGYLKKKGGKDG